MFIRYTDLFPQIVSKYLHYILACHSIELKQIFTGNLTVNMPVIVDNNLTRGAAVWRTRPNIGYRCLKSDWCRHLAS